jgi:excinuclease ABC subunit C
MVVFVDGKPTKNLYRKFKIKTKTTPDDFAMMTEVLKRRFKHRDSKTDDSFSKFPDLVIVDGGKGQLSSAHKVLTDIGVTIPLIGLAKKNEDIFMLTDNNGELEFSQRRLRYASDGYFLIQRIRDESHRFAINYHRKLRSVGQTASILDDVPGIGKLTKKRLLQAFGTVEGIKKAKRKDLEVIIKNNTSINNLLKILETSD